MKSRSSFVCCRPCRRFPGCTASQSGTWSQSPDARARWLKGSAASKLVPSSNLVLVRPRPRTQVPGGSVARLQPQHRAPAAERGGGAALSGDGVVVVGVRGRQEQVQMWMMGQSIEQGSPSFSARLGAGHAGHQSRLSTGHWVACRGRVLNFFSPFFLLLDRLLPPSLSLSLSSFAACLSV